MKSFLESVADETYELQPEETMFLFPTRRACNVFKRLWAAKRKKASLLPAVVSISELPGKLKLPVIADDIRLLKILHHNYENLYGHYAFDEFVSFGQQLLKDFNEIDRQLVDASLLFREISDLKTLESQFDISDETRELLSTFWSEFDKEKLSDLKNSFVHYWQQLPELYESFRSALLKKNLAYEGMAWRIIAESPAEHKYFERFRNIVAAGFYALNKSEEVLFEKLSLTGKLKLFRDADKYYTGHPYHEAGLFFRRGYLADENIPWTGNHFSIPKNNYCVKGFSGKLAISRQIAGDILKIYESEKDNLLSTRVAVVLSDEDLVAPLLFYCNRLGIPLNPTMGYPVKNHPVTRLLYILKENRRINHSGSNAGKLKQLSRLFRDPLISGAVDQYERERINALLEGKRPEGLSGFLESLVMEPQDNIELEKANILQLTGMIQFPHRSFMASLQSGLERTVKGIFALLQIHEEDLTIAEWWKLFLMLLEQERIPFESEQEKAIPVMGFLESRNLDFETVIIAPLNEGMLPSASVSKSLIPYTLRKAYGLPCREEQDAVTSYHFYRLLQRASDIRLYYNTDLGVTGGGERSRYLFQLHHELVETSSPKEVSYGINRISIRPFQPETICIEKSDGILKKLQSKFTIGSNSEERKSGFSASAINTYIACPLRFYLDQVAGIRPEEELEELSAGHFGNVLHKTMETVYSGDEGVSESIIMAGIKNAEEMVENAVREVYQKPASTGHDFLMKGVITELVKRILRFDLSQLPIRLIGLEQELFAGIQDTNGVIYSLKGFIDRLDEKDGIFRVLDYKTGKDELKKKYNPEDLFSRSDYKINFQLFFYALLVHENRLAGDLPVQAGIVMVREFEDGIKWLNGGQSITAEQLTEFRIGLLDLLRQIMDPAIPFTQTSDLKQCRYCSYNGFCNRQGNN